MNDDTERCPATNRNGEPCGHPSGWGTDSDTGPCKFHGGTQPTGKDSPNYKHGAFSKHFKSDLTEKEEDAYDDLVDVLGDSEQAGDVVQELAGEAILKYKRSGDPRFLREARQLLSEFNVVDSTDHVELGGEIGHAVDVDLDDQTKEHLDSLTGAPDSEE